MADEMIPCPVCEAAELTVLPYETWPPPPGILLRPPYEDALGRPSYEVCPNCGFEFGNDDNPGTAPPVTFEEYRRAWEAEGAPRWSDLPFVALPDGMIEVRFGSGRGLPAHALNDAIGSRAPRGAVRAGLSTYWVDRTEEAARKAIAARSHLPFASGNASYLRFDGDKIVLAYQDDPSEDHAATMAVREFLQLLKRWRERIIRAGGVSGAEAAQLESDPPSTIAPTAQP